MTTQQLYADNFPHMSPTWSRIFNFLAAMDGHGGDPNDYRDYVMAPPPVRL